MFELNFFNVIVQHFKHHTRNSIHLHFFLNPFLELYVNTIYTWIYMSFIQFLTGVPITNLI